MINWNVAAIARQSGGVTWTSVRKQGVRPFQIVRGSTLEMHNSGKELHLSRDLNRLLQRCCIQFFSESKNVCNSCPRFSNA